MERGGMSVGHQGGLHEEVTSELRTGGEGVAVGTSGEEQSRPRTQPMPRPCGRAVAGAGGTARRPMCWSSVSEGPTR